MRQVAVLRAFVVFILVRFLRFCATRPRERLPVPSPIHRAPEYQTPESPSSRTLPASPIPSKPAQLGEFVRPLLKAGTYTITVEVQGFRKAEQKGVIVTPGDRIGVNITLQVGQIDQTVEVHGRSARCCRPKARRRAPI